MRRARSGKMVGAWSTWIGEIVSAGEKRDERVSTLVRLCKLEKNDMLLHELTRVKLELNSSLTRV